MADPLADAMRREWRARHDPDYDPEDRDAKSICDHLADALRDGGIDLGDGRRLMVGEPAGTNTYRGVDGTRHQVDVFRQVVPQPDEQESK